MPRSKPNYRIDDRVLLAIDTLAKNAGMEPGRYVERHFFNYAKDAGIIPASEQPLGDIRGSGKGERRGAAWGKTGRPPIVFRRITRSNADVDAMIALQEHYEPDDRAAKNLTPSEARAAISKYGRYLIYADYHQRIVGGAGIWPIGDDEIAAYMDSLDEDDLEPNDSGQNLYISGFNVLPDYRRNRSVLGGLIREVASVVSRHAPTWVYAIAAKDEGAVLCRRFGFESVTDRLYRVHATPELAAAALTKYER